MFRHHMKARVTLVVFAAIGGFAAASFAPSLPQNFRNMLNLSGSPEQPLRKGEPEPKQADEQGVVKLSEDGISAAGIENAEVRGGTIAKRIIVPGSVVPHGDRIARVSVKLPSIVAELRKRIGDAVTKGEIIAILESREVADAKSEYLAARLTNELQQDLFDRDKMLWDKRISSEQQFLRSRNSAAMTKMRLDITRQKLIALGLDEPQIASLPTQPEATLRRHDVVSPISGRIVERKVDLGTALGRDNLETELFIIVDLDRVWIELAVSPGDLPAIHEGQRVDVTARGVNGQSQAKIIFVSPLLDKETRSARVVAEMPNPDGAWRPGWFITAAIVLEDQPVPVAVPLSALQTLGTDRVVFVRTPEGFQKRGVVIGRSDTRVAEVVSGLRPGENIAVSNTFTLKAEVMKSLAAE